MVTIKEVAQKTGFSTATVSMVLNNSRLARNMSQETRSHIKRIARELGYTPNHFARSLRSMRSRAIGVIARDITDPYCAQIFRGIESFIRRRGYVPILTDTQCDGGQFEHLIEILLERRVDGLITLGSSLSLDTTVLEGFVRGRVPAVMIGRECNSQTISTIAVDNESGARLGIEHLIALGHRNIAFIKGPKDLTDATRRWSGVCSLAQETRLALDRNLIIQLSEPASTCEGGYRATQALLARKRLFTAIMAFDDMTACGAIRALSAAGLGVPGDCSVIGFDDVALAASYNPTLSTIRQPLEKMGFIGAEILLKLIKTPLAKQASRPVLRSVKPALVIRESTASPGNPTGKPRRGVFDKG